MLFWNTWTYSPKEITQNKILHISPKEIPEILSHRRYMILQYMWGSIVTIDAWSSIGKQGLNGRVEWETVLKALLRH